MSATLSAEEKRKLRLEYISYMPQGSMSVLNPVLKLKETYQDFIGSHVDGQSRKTILRIGPQAHPGDWVCRTKCPRCLPTPVIGRNAPARDHRPGTLLKPRIIIGDEPTTALDVVVQRGVIQMLKDDPGEFARIRSSWSRTIWACTPTSPTGLASCMPGRSLKRRTTEKIFGKPLHPYTQFLINSLPKFGDKNMRDSVPGSPPSLADLPSGCPFHPRCPHAMDDLHAADAGLHQAGCKPSELPAG